MTLVLALAVFAPSDAIAQTIRVGGTGAPLAALRQLGTAFGVDNPGMRVEVLPSMGSGGGLRAVADGVIDIAVSARPLTESERASGLVQAPFASTAVALLTSHTQDINITIDDLATMFVDPAATWPDGAPVRVIVRPESESDVRVVLAVFPALEQAFAVARQRPDVPMAATDQQNIELAVTMEGSLTIGTLLQVWSEGARVYLLPIDGVSATLPNLSAGSYPLGKDFFLVVRSDTSGAAQEFLDFLRSDAAQTMMRRLGALPVG